MRLMRICVVAVMGMVVVAMGTAGAGDLENQGRAILEKYQQSVVTVQLVIKQKFSAMGMGGEENESKEDATGVVIDPSGLIVLSLTATDPMSMYSNVMSAMGEEMADKFKMESNVTDVKILLQDGTELPGQIVLRDKDLDLAFVRPVEKPAQPMAAVDLTQSGEPQILDPVISLSRLGRVAGRVYAAGVERIQAIIRKPRLLYVPGSDPTHSGLGSPVFTLDGKIVGVGVLRTIKSEGRGLMGMMGGMTDTMLAIIVPASDILEGAKQAPMQAPKEAPQEAPKEAPKETAPAAAVPKPMEPATK